MLALAIALFAMASNSEAQTIQFLGGGSSALFLELGQAATTIGTTPCSWTAKKTGNVLARDNRPSTPVDEQGNIWVTWGTGTGTCTAPVAPYDVYSYMSLDSVVGDRCFFGVDSSGIPGCVQVMTVGAGTAGANLLTDGTNFMDDPGGIPADVINALNGQHFFVAGTDIRPEDAKFAVQRMFTGCTTPITRHPYNQTVYQTIGLGYQTGTPNVGTQVLSSFSSAAFNVLQFNIAGKDPFTNNNVPTYTVSTVGAQPIVITVSPAGGTGLGAASDISGFNLALFMNGTLGRATNLVGPTSANAVTVLVREPLSGTYNTFEYSNPNSAQFKTSQDASNCNNATNTWKTNPLNVPSANSQVPGAARKRVIGTGEMVATLQAASTDTLGYFFWSAGNAANFTSTNGKYLTVNGVDPIANSYSVTGGVLPTGTNLSQVTFQNLNAGDYPIWSALRLVSKSPTPAGVTNVINAAQTLNSTQHDFITLANLQVWHSHFNITSIGVNNESNGPTINTSGDLCGTAGASPEGGGDAGGTNVSKKANHDFCSDFGNKIGLVNKNN